MLFTLFIYFCQILQVDDHKLLLGKHLQLPNRLIHLQQLLTPLPNLGPILPQSRLPFLNPLLPLPQPPPILLIQLHRFLQFERQAKHIFFIKFYKGPQPVVEGFEDAVEDEVSGLGLQVAVV